MVSGITDTVVLAAVRKDGLALRYASYDRRADPVVVLNVPCSSIRLALEHARGAAHDDHTVVLAVVRKDGLALRLCVV